MSATIDEMRALLGLDGSHSDAFVASAYAASSGRDASQTEAAPIVTMDEARRHLRLLPDDDSEDASIALYLSIALAHLDGPAGILGRAVTPQTIVREYERFEKIGRLPYPPVIEVVSIERHAGDGWTPVSGSFRVTGDGRVLCDAASPGNGRVRVTWRAGYDGMPGRTYPPALKGAVLLMLGDLFAQRGEAVIGVSSGKVEMAPAVASLIAPFRVWSV